MLSPDYLLRISEGGEAIAETLHDDIIKQIVERIAIRLDRGDNYLLTARDKWQIEVLQDSGYLREEIEKTIARHTGLMQKEIAEAMEDAGVKAIDFDNEIYKAAGIEASQLTSSPYLIRLMQRNYEATVGNWVNFTRTTAEVAQQAFISACDNAYVQVASGAVGYGQAYKEAIESIVGGGIEVKYPSGHKDTIETATLRCIRTGVSQATAQITDARMEEMDWDIILVSAHLGARVTEKEDYTNHYWWQGKFYSRTGRDKRFPPFSVCGEGNVQGIHGANCRHSHGPGDGEFNPYDQYDSEENRKEYELQQSQRTMERRIRDSKRKCMGLQHGVENATTDESRALVQAEYDKQAALLKKRNKAYNDFCEENNLKRLNERVTIAKWDRQQAAKARAAAKRAEKESMQMFKLNSAYRTEAGSFDIETAKKDYANFLTSIPEKNRMLLQQSFKSVEYENAKLKNAPFGYLPSQDKVLYDTSRSDFWGMDFITANTHELAHRIDRFFARSVDSIDFSTAIANAREVIEVNPQKFIDYCRANDQQGFLSDVFSAISGGKYRFTAGHDAKYWAKAGNKEREIFANLFSLEAFQDADKLQFFRDNFAELLRAFKLLEY